MKELESRYAYDGNYPYLKDKIENANSLNYKLWIAGRTFSEIYLPLRLRPGQLVLDVGSCIGDTGYALRWGGITTVGVDINKDALITEKEIFSRTQTQSVQGDASMLPFIDNSFDAVISQDLLEHLPNEQAAEQAFSEMVRVCKGNKMLHKITVLEDTDWIHADESHRIKWAADQWRSWFEERGWSAIKPTTRKFLIIKNHLPSLEKMHGYFLLERDR